MIRTCEDPKFKSSELNNHSPVVKGWQSAKNCDFPQEIMLQLEKQCLLTKVQVLAHQYLIPSKIELFASNQDTNTIEDVVNINWDYIGYITLSDNQSSMFKSRELKSVSVPPCVATFLKLKLGKNHTNAYNVNNQVSVIAVNVLGNELEARKRSIENESIADKLNALISDPEYVSPYDDLAFEMYVDVGVANTIREMELKKHLAVLGERYEYARKLKQTIERLRIVGERLGKYDLEKRHAIEMEDYERARHKKKQMEEFRQEAYANLFVEQLLEANGVCLQNDECVDEDSSHRNVMSPTSKADKRIPSPSVTCLSQGSVSPIHNPRHPSPKTGSPCTGSPTNIQTRGSLRRRNKSAGAITKTSYEQYEEKPLPTLRHSQTNEFLRECQMECETKTTSKLTERERKQAALPILVFANDLVEKFYSKHYLDKEEGLNRLKEELLTYNANRMHTANKTGRAAIFLLHRALRDKVFSVYSLANEVIRLYFVQFVPGRVSPAETARSVDKLLPELLTKSGDTSTRIHHMAVHTILTMADCKNVRDLHIIPTHLSRNLNTSTHPRLALSRAEMVEQLIINQGISTDKQSGLTCRTLSEFGLSGLHHPAEPVRKVSERILVLVYKVNPRLVRKQLPPDDDITRRNLLYRQLFHEFDKIDIQRKKEVLERNRLIQQCSLSPEPDYKASINKSISSIDVPNENNDQCQRYVLAKSVSGGNISNINGNGNEKQSTSSASALSSPSNTSQPDEGERHCIFCHEMESTILLINKSMNSHYWRNCPMLVRCNECSQVVEVSALSEHLIMECEQKELYTQCSQCTEAVKLSDFEKHSPSCIELAEGHNRCPLCHGNIEDEESTWKTHLMGDKPCLKNTRVKHHKQVTIQI
ncbi:centrosomal protein of 104 kDa isoform X2 [Photinus pyralis]|uniref:centrosomal protein of 104 kDa isoform X2 n=1 Tax=Photinus pyralis TaxID=7054 RepID=UPI001266F1F9|nr:centrosomal protein of 104 kDa isoform X2 [Photinus pyralis]